jgi:hypothetical protein
MRYYLVWQIVRMEGNDMETDEDIVFCADSDKWEVSEATIPKKVLRA